MSVADAIEWLFYELRESSKYKYFEREGRPTSSTLSRFRWIIEPVALRSVCADNVGSHRRALEESHNGEHESGFGEPQGSSRGLVGGWT